MYLTKQREPLHEKASAQEVARRRCQVAVAGRMALQTGEKSAAIAMERELTVAVFRNAIASVMRLRHECGVACTPDCTIASSAAERTRVFRATPDQVRAVRQFVQSTLAGHPAVDDAVLVASELATNSVAYGASNRGGRLFLVHVADIGATHAAVLVAERSGPGASAAPDVDAEPWCGLAVVRSLTCLFIVSEARQLRSVLAVVPAESAMFDDAVPPALQEGGT